MNSSLRIAFRALLFSVTLPLVAFVVAELVPRAPRPAVAKRTASRPQAVRISQSAPVTDEPRADAEPAAPRLARKTTAGVILGPDVEDAELDEPLADDSDIPRVVLDRRPVNFRVLDTPAPRPPATEDKRLETRLASMQQTLSQLSRLQLAQAQQQQQQQQADQLQQAAQLLQQMQQNNQFDTVQRQMETLRANSLADPTAGMQSANPPPAGANFPSGNNFANGLLQLPGANPPGANPPGAPPLAVPPAPPVPNQPGSGADSSDENPDSLDGSPNGESAPAKRAKPGMLKVSPAEDGSDRFSLQIKDAEIHEVLEMIGQLSGTNILPSRGVTGTVSANLHEVTLEQALNAILKSGDYVHEHDGDFVYVFTRNELDARTRNARKLLTKIYRPHYISVKDLRALVTPILTPSIGKISVTNPSEVGIATSNTNAGGDTMTQRDALLVQDYTEVLAEIDRIVVEMDVPPMQVAIQAHIMSVKLNDSLQFGVNFALINKEMNNSMVTSGNGQTLFGTSGTPGGSGAQIIPAAGQFVANTAGMKYGLITGDLSLFISALENIADTDLVAKPQLLALNKQRAELIIGDRISYKTLAFNGTQTVENVNFLDAGTKLRLRPFIAPDGLIRMEIHPERSSATQNSTTGLPNLNTTEVTTNVMVKDGTTIIIGGLIEEQDVKTSDRVPFLGALPVIGAAFRNTTVTKLRTELIILITPTIVRQPDAEIEGALAKFEGERRAESFRNNSSLVSRGNLARVAFEKAQTCFDRGDLKGARRHIKRALYYDPNSLRGLRLKDQIDGVTLPVQGPAGPPPVPADPPVVTPLENPGREPLPVLGDDSPEPLEQRQQASPSQPQPPPTINDLPPAPPYDTPPNR